MIDEWRRMNLWVEKGFKMPFVKGLGIDGKIILEWTVGK
jgi:hypothetical protein